MKPYISVVIPAYNEESRIGKSLGEVIDYLDGLSLDYEILVIDDGSTDGTVDISSQFSDNVRVIQQSCNKGKGAAVKRGMLEASGELVVFSDADLSTPIYEISKLIKALEAGSDVCVGSRALEPELIKEHQPFYREFMGKTFNKIIQLFLMKGILDTQCGFKGFKSKAAQEIFSKSLIEGFGFDVEIIYLAKILGFKVEEIPVEWFNDERSKVSPVKDSIEMFLDIFRVKKLHKK